MEKESAKLQKIVEIAIASDDPAECEKICKILSDDDDIPLPKKLEIWLTLLCGGKPSDAFAQLEKMVGSSACGKIWKKGDFSYQCKDCQFDETCAICVDCFKAGNHEGHDYNLHVVSGGCCDCGDVQAWKVSGFCTKHAGNNSVADPIAALPARMQAVAPVILRSVCNYTSVLIKRFIISIQPSYPADLPSSKSLSDMQAMIVSWMMGFAQRGDAFRRLIGNAVTAPIADLSREVVLLWLINFMHFPVELQKLLNEFFLVMFTDQVFKRKFAGHFVKQYRSLFFDEVSRKLKEGKKEKGADILGLSIQLFTIPAFMEDLVKVHDSASVMIHLLAEIITSCRERNKPHGLDGKHPFLEKNISWHVLIDLRHIFSFVEASRAVLWEKEAIFRQLLEVFGWVQFSSPMVRQQGEHVQYEGTEWFQVYGLSLELQPLVSSLVYGLRAGPSVLPFEVSSEKLPEFPRRQLNDIEAAKIQSLLFAIVEEIRKFFANLQPPLDWHRLKGCNMIDFDVGSSPVSFHLPLHRIFASFLSAACQQLDIQRLEQLLPAPAGLQKIPAGFVQQLIEHPLQLQVLMAQELANLWVRNGAMVPQQTRLYRFYPRTFEMSDQDMLVLQTGAALLPPTLFLTVCADRFRLIDYFTLHPPLAPADEVRADPVAAILAEEFLRMLLMIFSDRSMCGALSQEQLIELEVVSRLALGPMAFSQLSETLPEHLPQNKNAFNTVLQKVADFVDPKGLKKGAYHLKTSNLSSFSQWIHPYHLHYAKKNLVSLEENWKAIHKALNNSTPSLPHPKLSAELILPCFRPLLSSLRSQLLFNMVFVIIHNTIADQRPASITLLQTALHLLHCMIDLETSDPLLPIDTREETAGEEGCTGAWNIPLQNVTLTQALRTQIKVKGGSTRSLIELLVMLTDTRSFQLEIRDEIQRILHQLSEQDEENKKIIESSLSQEQLEEERKKKLRSSRAQQQKILQDFQNKQKAFAATIPREGEMDEDEDEDAMQQSSATEEVCVLCKSSTRSSPLGVIGYLHQSSVLPIALAAARDVPYVHVDEHPQMPSTALEIYDRHFLAQQGLNSFAHSTPCVAMFNDLSEAEKQKFEAAAKRDAERYVRQEAECTHARNWSNLKENDAAELYRNVNTLPSAYMSGCGHVVHAECHDGYMASLWKQAEDPLAAALYGLQLEDGEFRCPACRSLGNTVLPLSPRNRSKQTVSTAAIPHLTEQQLSGWVLRRLGVAASLSVSPSAPEGPIMSFLMRAVGAREMLQSEEVSLRPNHLPFPAVLHQIVSTMCSSAELASRGRPDALFTYPHRVLIERVLNAARQSTTASQRASVLSVLVPVLIPMLRSNLQSKSPPLLSLDLFTVLVHLTLALDSTEEAESPADTESLSALITILMAATLTLGGDDPKSCAVFLRRAALFVHTLTGIAPPRISSVEDEDATVAELCVWLHVPPPAELSRWSLVQNQLCPHWKSQAEKVCLPPTLRLVPYHFNKPSVLPRELQKLGFYSQLPECRCQKCGKSTQNTAICLTCGTYVCALSSCCMDPETREGEATVHAAHCSGGVAMFMLLRETIVLLMRNGGACLWGSLYLDAHGEEDENLRRGKPLFLDAMRYERLRLLWLEHGIPQETVASERPIKASSWWTF